MNKFRDFRCNDCNKVTEEFVKDDVRNGRCSCGGVTSRMLSAPPFVLEGASGDFPGRHMRWVREHEKAGRSK